MLGVLAGMPRVQGAVALPLGGELEAALRERGISVYGLEFNKHRFVRRPKGHIRFFLRLYRILRASKPDLVVINLGAHLPLIFLACKLRGIPLVYFERCEFRPPKRRTDGFCLRRARAIICPAKRMQRNIQAWLPDHAAERVYQVYNPQDMVVMEPNVVEKTRQDLSLVGRRLIGYFGRFHPLKRVETLLQALPLVRASFSDVHLIVVGGHDGSATQMDCAAYLRQLASGPGCAGAVSFLEYRRDVSELMACCELTVLPSETESFGRVLAESWSMAVPTVAADIPACREITDASGGGLLFPVGDHEELARCICQLLASSDRARSLGESGQQWVARACDPVANGREVQAILEQVVARG